MSNPYIAAEWEKRAEVANERRRETGAASPEAYELAELNASLCGIGALLSNIAHALGSLSDDFARSRR